MRFDCAQIEERLSDYLDGMLGPEEAREFSAHADSCSRCAPLVKSVSGVVSRMRALEPVEAPPQLISKILEQTLGPGAEKQGWRAWFGWLPVLWRPRFAMGAISVFATFFLLIQASGTHATRFNVAALSPVNLYHSADRQAHLIYARSAKFVNDLRVVYEIQSRLRPDQTPAPQEPAPAPPANPQQKSEREHKPGQSANHDVTLLADACAEPPVRSSP
jgi:anti-sigma factor RsiW